MKVDLTREFFDPMGQKILPTEEEHFTLREVIVRSLMADFKDELEMSGENKLKRYQLGMEVMKAEKPIELTLEQAVEIKSLVAKMYGILVSAQAWEMLEGN